MSIENAISELKNLMKDRITVSASVRTQYGQNETYYKETLPDAVAYPKNEHEVSEILQICNRNKCPIVPWGTGTSLEGNSIPINGGLTLSFENMKSVVRVNPEDMDVTVQPGITREELNQYLKEFGLFFPVDPGANASIGGMAATRASGTTAVRYGTMKENVIALKVVMSDGRVIKTGSRARKSSAGYDLTKLIVGSEGTLGVITEVTLRLQGIPEEIASAICSFPDAASAVRTIIETIQLGIPIARSELMDSTSIEAVNEYSKLDLPIKEHLFFEFHGSKTSVKEQSETVQDIAAGNGGSDFKWSTATEDRNKLWKARHNYYYAIKAKNPNHTFLVTDICVPISNLAQMIDETAKEMKENGMAPSIMGHVGDGNFHSGIMVRPNNYEDINVAKDLTRRIVKRALDLEGTCTGEHGVGIGKIEFMEQEHGESYQVMASIKRTFDPNGILNPGKVVKIN
jgi:D-lactate dehydrogenase (cytochrome)